MPLRSATADENEVYTKATTTCKRDRCQSVVFLNSRRSWIRVP